MNGIAYVDGAVTDLHEARIPLNDRGYLLGDGVFETLRVADGRPFRVDLHAARLRRGLRTIGLEPELESEFHAAAATLVREGCQRLGRDLYLRIQVSTGPMDDIVTADRGILVTGIAKPFRPYPRDYLEKGVDVVMSTRRKDRSDPLCAIKTLSFLPHVQARREAHARHAHDALLGNDAGRIAEASTSNVFALRGDTLHAPGESEGALPGTTRHILLEMGEDMGLRVETLLTIDGLRTASEAWLSNTTGGVVPIRSFEGRPVGDGRPGATTIDLQERFEALVQTP